MKEKLRKGYETFEHGADIGIRGFAPTLEEAFSETAKAMFSYMYDINIDIPPSSISTQKIKIELEEEDLSSLLIRWLNTLLAESDINSLAFIDFQVDIKDMHLTATAIGISNKGLPQGTEVKGATYSGAKVFKREDAWIAQCVIDV